MGHDGEYEWLKPNQKGRPTFSIPVVRISNAATANVALNAIAIDKAVFREGDSLRVGFNERSQTLEISRTADLACFRLRRMGSGCTGLVLHSRVLRDKLEFAAGKTYRVSDISDGLLRVQLTPDNAVNCYSNYDRV